MAPDNTTTGAAPVPPVPAVTAHRNEAAAASVGARSVADAVKRLADAAVAEVEKESAKGGPKQELAASGTVGGRFRIRDLVGGTVGSFGPSGTVTLNGKQLDTDGWSTMEITGKLPADAKSGEVVVIVDAQTQRRGHLEL